MNWSDTLCRLSHFKHRFNERLAALSQWQMAALVVALTVVANLIYMTRLGTPPVHVHDEFGYLLTAETFSQGRLSTPTHPMWRYFETMHVLHEPSLASKFPPAHAIMLAIGIVLGHPLIGVYLESILAALAVYYLLSACVSRGWALVGTILGICHPLSLEWGQNYWGGSLQVIGGAVTLGALIRGYREPRWSTGLVLGVGLSTLALSRPWEGGVYAALCFLFMLGALWHAGWERSKAFFTRLTPGVVVVLAIAMGWLGYYHYRVTGHPLHFPYTLYDSRYEICPVFLWQTPKSDIVFHHQVFADFGKWGRDAFDAQQTWEGFLNGVHDKARKNFKKWTISFYLLLPLLAALYACHRRVDLRLGFLLVCLFFLIELSVTWIQAHYLASLFGIVMLLCVVGFQELAKIRWVGGVLVAIALAATVHLAYTKIPGSIKRRYQPHYWANLRHQMISRLQATPGQHLVLVEYGPKHSSLKEWVYNPVNIDASKVLFARSMNDNGPLLEYYKDRTLWHLYVNEEIKLWQAAQ